jgi:hypothetical protein
MAYMVARTEKRKVGSLSGYQNHVDRKTENHSNKDIDDSKTYLNYDLVGHEVKTSFHEEFMAYINENRVGSRAVRKDAVVMQDWIIGSSQEFFDSLNPENTRRYFETAVKFFAEKFGRENIRFATVHMDEKTPHMHMGIVPMKDGKLTAKTIFDRNCLRMVQNELPQAFQKAGFDIQRGEPKSEKVHLQPEEYKATMRAAQEKSKEIIEQAETKAKTSDKELREQSYDLWETDWDKTEKEIPDLRFTYFDILPRLEAFDNLVSASENPFTRDVPRKLRFSFKDMMTLFLEKVKQVQYYISSTLQYFSRKETEIEKRENTLTESYKLLETNLEQFEDIKHNFDELIDDINPESQFNKNINDAFVALECYDKALKEEDWIKLEDYSSEDEMWREVYSEYTLDQNFSIRANAKMTWEDNLLRGVTKKGFIHEIKNQNGQIERGIPWTRLEIKTYLKHQIEERAKLKFDVSGIKENIAEQRTNLLNKGLDRDHGMSL